MIKRYFVTTVDKFLQFSNNFHPQHGATYLDLQNGEIVLTTRFENEGAEIAWETLVGEDGCLPHPAFDGTVSINIHHANKVQLRSGSQIVLQNHGQAVALLKKAGIVPHTQKAFPIWGVTDADTVIDLARKLGTIQSQMGLRGL